ncbi:MAG: secretin N-terminal domain-containing protein [Planctomycetota bacterium]
MKYGRMRLFAALAAAGLGLVGCAGFSSAGEELEEALGEPSLPGLREQREPVPFQAPTIELPAGGDEAGAEPPAGDPAAASPIGDDTRYPIDLRGMPIAEAVHLIASMAGVNIVLDSGLTEPVDANFPSITLDEALTVLLERRGLTLVEEPPGIYWVERTDGTQVETQLFQLNSIAASDVTANLDALVSGSVEIVVDVNQNFIVARGTRADLDFIESYLAQADRLKAQVLIEVEILEVTLNDSFELGIQAALTDTDLFGDVLADLDFNLSTDASDFTVLFEDAGQPISVVVNALSTFGAVNVVSSPRVLAVTNSEALVQVITEVPYIEVNTQITSGGDLGTTSQQQVSFKEVGIKMTVTPVVQEGGVIGLQIDQEFSEVVDFFLGIPVIDARRVTTSFLVNEAQTAMIGGLIQDRQTESDRGVPVLMHLPLVGRLFRSDEDAVDRRELVVLLRPRVADPAESSLFANEYHESYVRRVRAAGLLDERELGAQH